MTSPLQGISEPLRAAFDVAYRAAERVAHRRSRLLRIVSQVGMKIGRRGSLLGTARLELGTLVRMVRAYANGSYTRLPWRTLTLATGAILYFLSPVDLIPDVLVGIGFVDDVAVISAVAKSISSDLASFKQWESATGRLWKKAGRLSLRPARNRSRSK